MPIEKWIPVIILAAGQLIVIGIAWGSMRANQKNNELRLQEYIETDRTEAYRWRERHEQENRNAWDRIDTKIREVNGRIFRHDGRPIYASREDLEALRLAMIQGQAEIREDNRRHYEGVAALIKEMIKEVKVVCAGRA